MLDKKCKKRIKGECCLCKIRNYNILDVHRIIPGSEYTDWGTVVLCSNCHRRNHSGEIEIVSKYKSTRGDVINYIENGENKWTDC